MILATFVRGWEIVGEIVAGLVLVIPLFNVVLRSDKKGFG